MTDISETFATLKDKNEAALIAYLTVGDPAPPKTYQLTKALIEGGADIIELGIPFSDPIADGPIIQSAMLRSLSSGSRPVDALTVSRMIREKYDVPIVLMTYFNPVFRFGVPKFIASARKSSVSGIIVPDLPVEEAREYKAECTRNDIDTIFLASPSTDQARLSRILAETSGYLYLVSLYGVTGLRTKISQETKDMISKYHRLAGASLPLAVGFGISKPQHVRRVINAGADGVIVGSAFVKIIGDNRTHVSLAVKKLRSLAKTLKKATAKN